MRGYLLRSLVCSILASFVLAHVFAQNAPGRPAGGAAQDTSPGADLYQKFSQERRAGNKQAAIDYLLKAAELGNANALSQLGEEYRGGDFELQGVLPVDNKKAYEFTKKAVDQGSARAMTGLGVLYLRGIGVEKDAVEAHKWFLKAVEVGDMKALRYAAVNYENGIGTPVDYEKAAALYRKAVESNDITGTCLLGSLYERGLGVAKDYSKAEQLFLKSSERGDAVASAGMIALGNLYETRTDARKDMAIALDWYKKAAAARNPAAQAEVARLTAGNPKVIAPGRNLCLTPFP